MEDHGFYISRLRLNVKVKLEDLVCAHKNWLAASKATKKLKFERMKVLNRVNRVIKMSREKFMESLVDTAVYDAPAKLWHTT